MTPPAAAFQTAVDNARFHVETLEPTLTTNYAAVIRKAGVDTAARFRTHNADIRTLVDENLVAGYEKTPEWAVPALDDLIDTVQVENDLLAGTASTRTKAAIGATRPIMSAMGVSFSLESPMVKDLVSRSGRRAAGIAIPGLRDYVYAAVKESFEQGLSVDQTADLILSKTDELADFQAQMLAQTDLIGTANGGSLLAAKAVYPEQGTLVKQWVNATNSNTENDGKIRPTHLQANGQQAELDDAFTVGEDQLLYPGDPTGSDAEVINCRCTIVYSEPGMTAASWDESKHPRHARGEHLGGKFAHKAGASAYVPARGTDSEEMAALRADFGAHPEKYFAGGEDGALDAIADVQGFDGLPEVVSGEELDRRIAGGSRELWRGLDGPGEDADRLAKLLRIENADQMPSGAVRAEQFRSGDYHAGQGTWGNGMYTAENPNVAIAYADKTSLEPWLINADDSRLSPAEYAVRQPSIVRMALRPDANIANGTDLRREWATHMQADETPNRGQVITRSPELALDSDLGRYAAARGYDAIDLDDGSGFFVLLNRTAVAVQEASS